MTSVWIGLGKMEAMIVIMRTMILLMLCFWATGAHADTEMFAKDSPRLIYVKGEANRTVPVECARLVFSVAMDKGSFEDSSKAGQVIVGGMREIASALPEVKSEITHGWGLVNQSFVSLGQKGRKIEHNIVIELDRIPEGQLHSILSRVIDGVLPLSEKLELQQVEVSLSQTSEPKIKKELYQEATKAALENAKAIAEASGAAIDVPRFLYASSDAVEPPGNRYDGYALKSSAQMYERSASVSIRKSFKVKGDVPDHLELSLSVIGIYDLK